ncbi:MAG TPA: GNAT family N-acetyltransferase [Gemmatimonadaceae bacterium]|nr:GNAT family N-acetyltransferase [Gemmatimonadaceae bacterium]
MRLTTFPTAEEFVAAVRPALAEHEAEHHLLLGVAEAGLGRPNEGLVALTVEDDAGLVGAAWSMGGRPLLLASDRESIRDAVPLICDALGRAGRRPTHAIGGVGQVDDFANAWAQRMGGRTQVGMRQRTYRLDRVAPVPEVSGTLRAATLDDLDLVTAWFDAFEREALPASLPHNSRAHTAQRVAAGEIFLWCDPEPRTMAGSARPTKRAVAVNAVYTPLEWRRRGYATACVAALSARLLERWEMCVLYTDLANPTSNAIYARIGYRPVKDFLMYELPV